MKLYTIAELSEALKISRSLAYRLVANGEIESYTVGRRGRRVSEEGIRQYLENQKRDVVTLPASQSRHF